MAEPLIPFAIDALKRGLATRFVGRQVRYYATLASTQDVARTVAIHGALEGEVHLADEQVAGRGRFDRRWLAPPMSSVLMSTILRPTTAVSWRLFMIAALAILDAIEASTGLRGDIKWPNDVLLNDKKVAGVLVETEFIGNVPAFSIVGTGINVNIDAATLAGLLYPATSLAIETGRFVEREAFARSLMESLERWYVEAGNGGDVRDAWRSRVSTIGKQIVARMGSETVSGLAEDVDADGSLLLRRSDGSLVTLIAGEVTLQR